MKSTFCELTVVDKVNLYWAVSLSLSVFQLVIVRLAVLPPEVIVILPSLATVKVLFLSTALVHFPAIEETLNGEGALPPPSGFSLLLQEAKAKLKLIRA